MERDDTLGIYALRLEKLAVRAFLDSVHEQERRLRQKFWRAVLRSFYIGLADNERSLGLSTGRRKLK